MVSRREFLEMVSAAGALAAVSSCAPRPRELGKTSGLDRASIVRRHNPHITSIDPRAVLSVGNGSFAFNVDCTGLQSLPAAYQVIPLCTMSHWGWHSKPRPAGVDPATLRLKQYAFHGRSIGYPTDQSGQAATFNYMRENPHRLNLGRIGLILDGSEIRPDQLTDIDQTLDLYTGIITSKFKLVGVPVEVLTCCHHDDMDAIGVRITSRLCAAGRLAVQLKFPYGASASNSDGADWNSPDLHRTKLLPSNNATHPFALIAHNLDDTGYAVFVDTSASAATGGLRQAGPHTFVMATNREQFETFIWFSPSGFNGTGPRPSFASTADASREMWRDYWSSGAAIDLSNCTDPRAPELERRIVLSQYLMAIHSAGDLPSQETGLLCNSWYGKFHLEMHWWHSVHFALWNRWEHFSRPMGVYAKMLASSRARAAAQGFAGARWPKMTAPDAWAESPSTINPLIIWQQPHPIYFAELAYRHAPTAATLRAWSEIVDATAEFLASFAQGDGDGDRLVLGPAIRTVPENNSDADVNPTYELTAWRFGLATAQTWRERAGLPRNAYWDRVLAKLSPAPTADGVYLAQEGQPTFTAQWAYEHPAMLGALGTLPGPGIDPATMAATVRKVREVWDFSRGWGWDFPLAAMAAARTGQPHLAIDFLTLDSPRNTYLPNGCNYQRDGLPAYFPGNGGLLAAIAMMAAGWQDGPTKPGGPLPGFPKNGKWDVRAEGFAAIL